MPAKRAKKKTAKKKATPHQPSRAPRKRAANKSTPKKASKSWLSRIFLLILVIIVAVAATYYFASFETRAKFDYLASSSINSVRTHESTPAFVSSFLDVAYDMIPTSSGLVVEGSELGRDPNIPFIAGTPNSRFPLQILSQPSYINMFSKTNRLTSCIAFRLDDEGSPKNYDDTTIQADSRFPQIDAQSMMLGEWTPYPLAPYQALVRQHGKRGLNDAQLATNHAPMKEAFFDGVWKKAMREFTERYPKRFDEIWIYLGPIYGPESSKFSSGISVPDGFYVIAFDLTNEGGLRALSLLIPSDAESLNLNNYITSIDHLEKFSGLQFLPDLHSSLRSTIGSYVSPSVW